MSKLYKSKLGNFFFSIDDIIIKVIWLFRDSKRGFKCAKVLQKIYFQIK